MNPRIVYCSITGFGSEGEPGTGKAMDAIIQALSGVMLTSGGPDDPPVRIGVPFADLNAPLFGVIGVLAAIHQAQRTGIGQHVDVSMLGVMTMMVSGEPFDLLERCGVPQRTGLTVPRLAPFGHVSNQGRLRFDLRTHGSVRACAVSRHRPAGTDHRSPLRASVMTAW